jgi:riboflavin kinase/FMN adenylyltransferase
MHGDFQACYEMLGRPYSIYGAPIAGKGKGKVIGYPTYNIQLDKLCHPPQGVYISKTTMSNRTYFSI